MKFPSAGVPESPVIEIIDVKLKDHFRSSAGAWRELSLVPDSMVVKADGYFVVIARSGGHPAKLKILAKVKGNGDKTER